ncbi:MAG: hypothetical protein FWG29_02260 [Treponema sp.]|nr:hypothetical protein [Treponema sp.]
METNNCMRKFCLLILILLAGYSAFAQNAEESTSYVTKTPEGFLIHQIIVFPAVSNTARYEVEIEHQTRTGYVPAHRLETAENRFEVALRAGNYRYRITSWNRMNLLEGRSEWQTFRVYPAVQPVLKTYQPFYGLYYKMEKTVGALTVYGEDFFPESEFVLVHTSKNHDWSGVTLEDHERAYIPDKVVVTENQATLHFGPGKLKTGTYDILARNPGGLWSTLGEVKVGQKHQVDWTFSFGWAPTFALFDIENALYDKHENSNPFGPWTYSSHRQLDRYNPQSYYARVSIIPIKTRIGNFGIEAQFDFLVDNEQSDNSGGYGKGFDSLRLGTFNLLYQYAMSERWQQNVRFGIGWGNSYHKEEIFDPWGGTYWDEINNALYFQLGLSTQYFLWKNFYAEAGIDFLMAHMIGKNHNHFMIRPGIGIGWQAGRWSEWAEVAEGQKKGEDYSVPVTDRPRAEWLLSLGWAPMIPMAGYDRYGWVIDNYGAGSHTGDKMLGSFNHRGLNFRAAYIPLHWGDNKLGMEVEASILDFPGRYKLDGNIGVRLFSEAVFGVRYQRVLNEDWQLNARAALGMIPIYAFDTFWIVSIYGDRAYYSDVNSHDFGFKFGASVQYFFWRNAYVEGGLDFALTKTSRDEYRGVSNDPRIYFRPSIGIGWQFNRNAETGLRLRGLGLPAFGGKTEKEPAEEEERP